MSPRAIQTLLLAVALAALAVSPALAQQEQPLTISDTTLEPGQTFTVSGDCPDEAANQTSNVIITGIEGGVIGEVTLDADAAFQDAEVTLPADAPTGVDAGISVNCPDTGVNLVANVQLVAADEAAPAPAPAPAGGVDAGFGGTSAGGWSALFLVAGLAALASGTLLTLRRL
jgi:hypothetical protein